MSQTRQIFDRLKQAIDAPAVRRYGPVAATVVLAMLFYWILLSAWRGSGEEPRPASAETGPGPVTHLRMSRSLSEPGNAPSLEAPAGRRGPWWPLLAFALPLAAGLWIGVRAQGRREADDELANAGAAAESPARQTPDREAEAEALSAPAEDDAAESPARQTPDREAEAEALSAPAEDDPAESPARQTPGREAETEARSAPAEDDPADPAQEPGGEEATEPVAGMTPEERVAAAAVGEGDAADETLPQERIAELEAAIASRDEVIAALEAIVSDNRERWGGLEENAAVDDKRVAVLEQELEAATKIISNLEVELAARASDVIEPLRKPQVVSR